VASADPEAAVGEDFMRCNVSDHEIFGNVLAYQEPTDTEDIYASLGKVRIARLRSQPNPLQPPYNWQAIFFGLPADPDPAGRMPPLNETFNGPEVGFDYLEGYEVVYTKEDAEGNWYHARLANSCQGVPCWELRDFPNGQPDPPNPSYENRWNPFVTQNVDLEEPAKVLYAATPGDRDSQTEPKRKVFRTLEVTDWNSPSEVTISGGLNATGGGFWARIDDKDYIISTLTDSVSGDLDIVLYDTTVPTPTPTILTGDVAGKHTAGWIGVDGATGRYTLVAVHTDPANNTFIEVYQRINNVWTPRYEFDAHSADNTLPTSAPYHVQSPELFTYMNRLYFAFVVADQPDSISATKGNIMITRVENDADPSNNHYRRLNVADGIEPTKKRIEPEVHYMFNDQPVVFYSQRSEPPNDPNCSGLVLKLMRARTGPLWQD
jgi:hypothetical protein